MEKSVNKYLIGLLKSMCPDKNIDEKTSLALLELEDIDYTELAIELEEKYEILLDELKIEKMLIVKEIIDYVEEELKFKE
jgi:acyl carrier protein